MDDLVNEPVTMLSGRSIPFIDSLIAVVSLLHD
jgi:hypothetical protein